MKKSDNGTAGYGFGTFQGVFTPSILTIIGVVMYLRFGWVLGSVGLTKTLVIVTISSIITFLTGLSISALATNMKMGGGGAYYMISRSLGIEFGAAVGIPLYLSQAVCIAFYVVGFTEAFTHAIPAAANWDPRIVGLATLGLMSMVATFSADWALKSQYLIMAAIVLSLISFFIGTSPAEMAATATPPPAPPGFWHVLAVFFPAVTGILSGVGMSGDLKNPSKSIPLGTIAAVLTGWAVYMAVPMFLNRFVSDTSALITDPLIMQKCARIPWLIIAGVWSASLSSALGGLLAAPRTLQSLAKDGVVPRFIGRGYGASNDPRISAFLTFLIAAAGIWLGDINGLAPILTIFNLTAYAFLNLSSGLEEMLGSPAWRPSFRVHSSLSFLGFAGCAGMMFMISPGATFIAAFCGFLIWWLTTRRELSARWGDMRTGLLVHLVHTSLRGLRRHVADTHTWRPNLLVFSGAPGHRPRLVDFAAALSGRSGLATYASVVDNSWTPQRVAELEQSMQQHLSKRGIDAQAKVLSSASLWDGIKELIRVYGYGPLEPNTMMIGDSGGYELADAIKLAISNRKNMVVLRTDSGELFPADKPAQIDVWWRGKSSNASFMLALAFLLKHSNASDAKIRLCHLMSPDENPEIVRKLLQEFLTSSRISAEIVISDPEGKNAFECLAGISAQSSVALIGLRPPDEKENPEDYAVYFNVVREKTEPLPQAIFACAAEELDFKALF